jgi:hypothetical protein
MQAVIAADVAGRAVPADLDEGSDGRPSTLPEK